MPKGKQRGARARTRKTRPSPKRKASKRTAGRGGATQPVSLDAIIEFLNSTPLFKDLDAAERGDVARVIEMQRLQDAEAVFNEGDDGDAWYVVFDGRAQVLKRMDGSGAAGSKATQIAVLDSGACFGEMAILDGLARSASVVAIGPLTVLRLRRERFAALLDQGSLGAYKLIAAMARTLSQRQRHLTQKLSAAMGAGAGRRDSVREYHVSE
ncbi:MAG TPA: cyclic nucleotide-binding domain-containing protein [Gemmatimonadaceae bacterium]|nr:cyclic nucleotide-binding domain-containing protein [Gemmatimonadaceae bacterium]